MPRLIILLSLLSMILLSLTICHADSSHDQSFMSGQEQPSDTKKPPAKSVRDFLTPDGHFDLEAARRSGYQGPLEMEGFKSAFDPTTNQPIFQPTSAVSPADDPDDIYWDNSISPGIPGTDGYVSALTIYNGMLIIGGGFKVAGNIIANGIAAWDGSTWSPLGSGMNDDVSALTVYDNKLIAGGYFDTAGGAATNNIAAWDGSSWSPLGSGTNSSVWALTVYDNKLIAGGQFTAAGSAAVNRIAAWDGSLWSPLGSGMNSYVNALAVYDNKLIAGGYFDTAGGVEALHIAAWNGLSLVTPRLGDEWLCHCPHRL